MASDAAEDSTVDVGDHKAAHLSNPAAQPKNARRQQQDMSE